MSTPSIFVAPGLLGDDVPELSDESLANLVESQLVHLNAVEAKLDLELGETLGAVELQDIRDLSHGSREDFARARFGFTWSHARELIGVASALRELPLLRKAFLNGEIRRARLRTVINVATPETEGEWLVLAKSLTSEQLRACVTAGDEPAAVADDDSHRVSVPMTPRQLVYMETIALPMLKSVLGQEGPKHELLHALAAEMLTESPDPLEPLADHDHGHDHEHEHAAPSPRKRAISPARARRIAQRVLARAGSQPKIQLPGKPTRRLLDRVAHAGELVRWRRSIDWQRARLLRIVRSRRLWIARDHASYGDWFARRLGLAPREVAALERIEVSLSGLDAIAGAWREGRITAYQADRLSRTANVETSADWLALARDATGKRFDLEVTAAFALRVELGDVGWRELTNGGRPMRDRSEADLRFQWAKAFEKAEDGEAGGSCNSPADLEKESSPRRNLRFGFDAPPAVADLFRRALSDVFEEFKGEIDAGECVIVMVERFAAIHVGPALADRDLRARILRRDGWTCTAPHCRSRRHLQVHHIKFRSHGGNNHPSNLTTLCSACHDLLHRYRLRIEARGEQDSRAGIVPRLAFRTGYRCNVIHEWREGLATFDAGMLAA